MSKRKRSANNTDGEDSMDREAAAQEAAAQEAEEMTTHIMEMNEHELLDLLGDLGAAWNIEDPPDSFAGVLETAFHNFDHDMGGDIDHEDSGSYGIKRMDTTIHTKEVQAVTLYGRMKELGMLEDTSIALKIRKVLESIFYAKRYVLAIMRSKVVMHDKYEIGDELEEILGSYAIRFRWLDSETNDSQKLLMYLLDVCMERRYRKFGDALFEPIIIDNHNTHAYRRVMDIKSFVHMECKKEIQMDAFLQLTSKSNTAATVTQHLTDCSDFQLPWLEKDRGYFSFRNGVYSCEDDRFYRFDREEDRVPDHIIAAKFFDHDIPEMIEDKHWKDIDTPNADRILLDQGFSVAEREWFYVFAGRMLYEIGKYDGWQSIVYLLGVAGSGKSTITDMLIGNMYNREDVGVLSNNCEPQWALSALVNKLIWIAPEVKTNFGLTQTDWQSMVSGESVLVAEKFKTPYSIRFTKPGFLAGNTLPSWKDNAGSVQRRLVIFRFDKKIEKTDASLGKRLIQELPTFIIKVNRAYREVAAQHGNDNIWEVLPQEFVTASEKSLATLSPLDSFMRSSGVHMERDAVVTVKKFKLALKIYAQENGFETSADKLYEGMETNLLKYNVTVIRHTFVEDGIEYFDADTFINVCLKETRRPVAGFVQDNDDGI